MGAHIHTAAQAEINTRFYPQTDTAARLGSYHERSTRPQ